MHPHAELITRFYTCFQNRDGAGMAACYHPDIHFSDEVFPDLKGERAGAMWRMLCERGKDLKLTFSDVTADESKGSARWDAYYTFGQTGRMVHNRITAEFEFRDGKIWRHRDRFDFHAWSRQALGLPGLLLGWTGFMKNKVRATAGRGLDSYIRKNAA